MNVIYTPLTMNDSEEFFRLAGDKRVAATMRFKCPQTIAESDRILADYVSEGNRTFAFRSETDGELQGVFAFKEDPDSDAADLSMMMVPEQWGQGLGNQVVSDMVELARKKKWYKAMEGYVLETNTASRLMAVKNGFCEKERHRFPGMTEDLVVYRIAF